MQQKFYKMNMNVLIYAKIFVVSMIALELIFRVRNDKIEEKQAKKFTGENYIIKFPRQFFTVYDGIFWFGLFLEAFFSILYAKGNETVTIGHLIFAAGFSGVGLIVLIAGKMYRVEVTPETLTIYRPFLPKKVIPKNEITEVKDGKHFELILFCNEKKAATIPLLENSGRLGEELKA